MNYPKKYDNNANCTWDIVAPPDQTIILQFGNGLALEDGFCYTEYVEVSLPVFDTAIVLYLL